MASDACTMLINLDKFQVPQVSEVQEALESKDDAVKIAAVKQVIMLILNGEHMPKLLMHVIRFCINSENHELKKLLMYYWEVVPKYDDKGALLPEIVLVCNALRNDLLSANEYVRGCTLRFLCHMRDEEILQPLVPCILDNVGFRHAYVRRNAVMALFHIYKHKPDLVPDAPQMVLGRLVEEAESDPSTRRNGFLMLFNTDQELATRYFLTVSEDINSQDEGFQLVTLELARKVCRDSPQHKGKFVGVIFELLQSNNSAVAYEAAETLVSMSAAPTAIRAAASAFCKLLATESDNNVKLIVLDRLAELKGAHSKVMREVVMDVLRALSTPDLDIQKKALSIALDLISARNVEEVVSLLKKEVVRTQSGEGQEKMAEYREALVQAISTCVTKFPEVAESVVNLLLDFVSTGPVAVRVIKFVREIVESFPPLRTQVLDKLMEVLPEVTTPEVMRVALWIIGEYAEEWDAIYACLQAIHNCIGSMPLLADSSAADASDDAAAAAAGESSSSSSATNGASGGAGSGAGAGSPTGSTKKRGPVVLADGTYASQSADAGDDAAAGGAGAGGAGAGALGASNMRKALVKGNYFLGAVLASTLTKLALRTASVHGASSDTTKSVVVDSMLVMCAILELGEASGTPKIDQDSYERVVLCLRTLGDPGVRSAMRGVLLGACREAYSDVVAAAKAKVTGEADKEAASSIKAQADDLITVRQLRGAESAELATLGLDDEADIIRATGLSKEDFAMRLRRVHQLTGYGDPVYAEAVVLAHEFDITLDITVVNRTKDTLTNLSAELATVGDLKLVDHLQSFSVGAESSINFKANIKVSSLESAHIYGTLVYSTSKSSDKQYVNLNDIQVNIMDYIHPAHCTDTEFRSMWADFEWENKVGVNTDITELHEFLAHVARITNTAVLTPPEALAGECDFLVANLYARSTFGEDAIANLSVQKGQGGKIVGHIRIRSKTQGVALSLGDRMTQKMKRASLTEKEAAAKAS